MSNEPMPAWLAELQASFSAMLRTPLDRSTGTLRAPTEAYAAPLCDGTRPGFRTSARERLAVYNRQYWFRLFGVLQSAYPLTTRLLGHWLFNEHAARFLLEHPPRGWDVDGAADGFDVFLERTVTEETIPVDRQGRTLEREALVQGAWIDVAFRQAFVAGPPRPFRPSPEEASRLPSVRLRRSPGVTFIQETWPLMHLRKQIEGDVSERPVVLPDRLSSPSRSVVLRTARGTGHLPLEPLEGRLFALLCDLPVGEALAQLESECGAEERATLPARTARWLARSADLGFFSGIEG